MRNKTITKRQVVSDIFMLDYEDIQNRLILFVLTAKYIIMKIIFM